MLLNESSDTFNCSTCKRKGACSEDQEYSERDPFRFKEFTHIDFDFCPFKAANDPETAIYFAQISALQSGINTFGEALTAEDLEALLIMKSTQLMLLKKMYADFWAKAFGGKK